MTAQKRAVVKCRKRHERRQLSFEIKTENRNKLSVKYRKGRVSGYRTLNYVAWRWEFTKLKILLRGKWELKQLYILFPTGWKV